MGTGVQFRRTRAAAFPGTSQRMRSALFGRATVHPFHGPGRAVLPQELSQPAGRARVGEPNRRMRGAFWLSQRADSLVARLRFLWVRPHKCRADCRPGLRTGLLEKSGLYTFHPQRADLLPQGVLRRPHPAAGARCRMWLRADASHGAVSVPSALRTPRISGPRREVSTGQCQLDPPPQSDAPHLRRLPRGSRLYESVRDGGTLVQQRLRRSLWARLFSGLRGGREPLQAALRAGAER